MEAKTTNSTTDIKVALTSLKNSTVKIKAPSGMIVILDDVDIDYSYDEIELTANGTKIKYKGNSYTKISIEKFNDQEQVNVSNKVINHNYRGKISLFVQNNQIIPVNEVPLEEYLYGVLPGEIGTSFPEEALKAQAVISRSYVLFSKKNNKNVNFDVYDSVMSQVYLGYDYESKKLNMIVDSTKDKVITYNEKIINAVFHSDSGGKTVNNEDAWGGQPVTVFKRKR
jgi:stage II sporulation protein D